MIHLALTLAGIANVFLIVHLTEKEVVASRYTDIPTEKRTARKAALWCVAAMVIECLIILGVAIT